MEVNYLFLFWDDYSHFNWYISVFSLFLLGRTESKQTEGKSVTLTSASTFSSTLMLVSALFDSITHNCVSLFLDHFSDVLSWEREDGVSCNSSHELNPTCSVCRVGSDPAGWGQTLHFNKTEIRADLGLKFP